MTPRLFLQEARSRRGRGVKKAQEMLHAVLFTLSDDRFGLPVHTVQEIVEVGLIRAVPHAPPFIEGVIELRGTIVPVVDLGRRLGLAPHKESEAERPAIIVEDGPRRVGLLVDRVHHVYHTAKEHVQPPPPGMLVPEWADLVEGIVRDGKTLILILNPRHIFTQSERRELEAVRDETTAGASS